MKDGRLTSIVRPPDTTASPSFLVAYHDTSPYWVELQQKVDNGNATTMRKFYNGLGQLIQTQSNGMAIDDGSGGLLTQDVIVDYLYDDFGRVTHQSMPYAVTPASGYHTPSAPASEYTVTDYDLRGRVVAVTPPNGAGQTISYGMAYQGDLGPTFIIDSSDANGHTTQTLKDAWERVVKVIPEEGSPVSYAYDGLGKLIAATTGVGTVAIQYDLGGRKLSMNDPDMGNWSYTYNALGALTAQTDARGCTSNLAYDALGRVTSKTFSGAGYCGDTPTVAYYYDGQGFTFLGQSYGGGSYTTGRRTAMLDGSGMTAWSYDQRGRVVSETRRIYSDTASTQAEAFTTQWSYNSADLPVTTTYPDGETLAIEYDKQGKPLTMANTNAFTYVRDVLYDEAGRMTGLGLGDTGSASVIQRNYSYYPWDQSVQGGRMSSLSSLNAASATLQSLAYTYDAAGNLTQISDEQADETSIFSYDGLDRLTGMSVLNDLSETVHSEVFTYDEVGRMSAKGADAQSLSAFSYDPQHPHAVNGLGSNTYSYDNNGNQVTRNLADLQYELSYDAENHLVDVDSSLAPSPTPTATPTTTPTATLYSIYLPMVMVVPNNATPTPAATANPTTPATPATPAATTTPTPEITPTATSVIAYPMLPQEEPQTPAGRQPQQTPKPAPQATPAPETANPSARGANTHPLQLPPNRPALAQDPTQEPSPTPTATPVTGQASYLYDGDGNLARGIVNGVVTFYPGRQTNREVDGANVTVKKFYTLGSSTVAVRTVQGSNDTLNWILGDHLGSASVTATPKGVLRASSEALRNADGTWNSEIKYTAFGEVRASYGLTPTDYRYTGQLEQAELGLVYFVARFYDPVLTHFVQADTIIPDPGDPLAWDRYVYGLNNPVINTDPTGHFSENELKTWFGDKWKDKFNEYWQKILLKGELGDAVAYTWDNGNPVLAVFALQDGMLVGWNLNTKTSASILGLTSRSQDDKMALYRSKNANQNGGPTQSQYWPVSNIWIENTDPVQAKYNGANHYLYVAGWAGGKDFYNLPDDWYQGRDGTCVRTYGYQAGFAEPGGGQVLTGVMGFGTMAARKVSFMKAFGGPLGVSILAVDLMTLSTWDTGYYVAHGYWGPAQPVPTP